MEPLEGADGVELERMEVSLGPGKGSLTALQRVVTQTEATDVAAVEAGNITMRELYAKHGDRVSGEGNGWRVWTSSTFLAQFLVNCPSFARGKSVLEVGCGCGVAGIAAGLAGARDVLLTDWDPTVLELAKRNIEENDLDATVRVAEPLDWRNRSTWPDPLPKPDLVIASDVLFNQEVHKDLVDFCNAILTNKGRMVICDPRQRMLRPLFWDQCTEVGLEVGIMFETEDMVLLNVMRVVAPGDA